MEGRAISRYVRMSPFKARLVARLIQGRGVEEAYAILQYTTKAAAVPILKTLRSAVSNAISQRGTLTRGIEDMVISSVRVDEGPTLKRFRPRAMGRAARIRRRTSHVTVVVQTRGEGFPA